MYIFGEYEMKILLHQRYLIMSLATPVLSFVFIIICFFTRHLNLSFPVLLIVAVVMKLTVSVQDDITKWCSETGKILVSIIDRGGFYVAIIPL